MRLMEPFGLNNSNQGEKMKLTFFALIFIFSFGIVEAQTVTVSQGYDQYATLILLNTGMGASFTSFPVLENWYNSTDYGAPVSDPNWEQIWITGNSSDYLFITRAGNGTTAKTHNIGGKTYLLTSASAGTPTPTFTPTPTGLTPTPVPLIAIQNGPNGPLTVIQINGASVTMINNIAVATTPTPSNGQILSYKATPNVITWINLPNGYIASGIVTLSNGLATVTTSSAYSGMKAVVIPQDTNTSGSVCYDSSTLVAGVSFGVSSTGIFDNGVVAWFVY